MKRLVVIGCGYTARRFVDRYGEGFEAIDVTARSAGSVEKLGRAGLNAHLFDGSPAAPALVRAISDATHLLVSAPPDADSDPTLRGAGSAISQAAALEWIGYLSTIGVYADADGAWVDESTPPEADSERGARRIEVEREWLALGEASRVPTQIFRLAGIYGPGRSAIENLRAGTAKRLVKPGQVFNRIHVDDIAAAIAAGIARPHAGPVVNVTDDEPAAPQDVVTYAAALLGVEPPPESPFETADLSPMARSFYSSNKRVSNRLLREAFGVDLAYPTYREGLAALAR